MWRKEHMEHGPKHGPTDCGCHGGRHFYTKEERMEMLEDYKSWLEKEKQGVEERIEELKKAL